MPKRQSTAQQSRVNDEAFASANAYDDICKPDLSEARVPPIQTVAIPKLLDRADVAAMLGVSERTVRRLVVAGRIPELRFTRTPRYRPEDVLALVQSEVSAAVGRADLAASWLQPEWPRHNKGSSGSSLTTAVNEQLS